jgi:hypothetical protein
MYKLFSISFFFRLPCISILLFVALYRKLPVLFTFLILSDCFIFVFLCIFIFIFLGNKIIVKIFWILIVIVLIILLFKLICLIIFFKFRMRFISALKWYILFPPPPIKIFWIGSLKAISELFKIFIVKCHMQDFALIYNQFFFLIIKNNWKSNRFFISFYLF